PARPPMGVDVLAAQPMPVPPMAGAPPMGVAPPIGGIGGPPMPIGPGWGNAFEVTRTFTVVATFGKEGGAGKLEDIVSVADKLLATAVTAGATEPPSFTTPANNQYGGFGGGGFGGRQAVNRIEFYRANVTAIRQ